jgi:hypothetical protein
MFALSLGGVSKRRLSAVITPQMAELLGAARCHYWLEKRGVGTRQGALPPDLTEIKPITEFSNHTYDGLSQFGRITYISHQAVEGKHLN